MAIETIYNFTISTDTLNGCVIPDLLLSEINAPDSGISIQCKSVNTDADNMSVTMKDVMPDHTNGTSSLLTSIVAAHDGTNVNAANIIQAQLVHEDGAVVDANNPLPSAEQDNLRDMWNKAVFHDTVRPPDCDTYCTSKGDDRSTAYSSNINYGDGQLFMLQHTLGGSNPEELVLDFNMEENKTYLHNAWIKGNNTVDGDQVTCTIIPEITSISIGSNTDFTVYANYLIIPASTPYIGEGAGQGTTVLGQSLYTTIPATSTELKFVQCVTSQKTGIKPAGYWNADWDSTNKCWKNILPAPDGTGNYNIFSYAVTFDRFINHWLLSNETIFTRSRDTAQIGIGMRLKAHLDIYGDDHVCSLTVRLYLHRQKTI